MVSFLLLVVVVVVVTWGFLLFDCPSGLSPTPVIVVSSYQSRLQLHVCQRGVVSREKNGAYSDTTTIHSLQHHQKTLNPSPPIPLNCIWICYPRVQPVLLIYSSSLPSPLERVIGSHNNNNNNNSIYRTARPLPASGCCTPIVASTKFPFIIHTSSSLLARSYPVLLFMYTTTTTTTRSIKNRRAVWKYSKSSCRSKPEMPAKSSSPTNYKRSPKRFGFIFLRPGVRWSFPGILFSFFLVFFARPTQMRNPPLWCFDDFSGLF